MYACDVTYLASDIYLKSYVCNEIFFSIQWMNSSIFPNDVLRTVTYIVVFRIGRSSGYKTSELASLGDGDTLCIGNKEIEVMGTLSEVEFKTGKCFSAAAAAPVTSSSSSSPDSKHNKSPG